MLNNITNFFNLIKTGKVKTQLDASDLLAIGTRDLRFIGQYQPTMIKYSDLASQILAGPLTVGVTSIASGTIGRVLFEGTNNKLSESANLTWDNANQNFKVVGNLFAGLNNYCSLSNPQSGYGAVGSNYYYEGNIAKRTNPDLTSQLDFSNGFRFKNAGGGLAGSTITWSDLGYWNGATGNLLVGTTTDSGFRLDVNGTARVQGNATILGNIDALGSSNSINVGNGGFPTFRINSRVALQEEGTTQMSVGRGYSVIRFSPSNTEVARFNGANLLINTTTDAGFNLDVNGTARFVGNVTASNFIGFVRSDAFSSANGGFVVFATSGSNGNARFNQFVSIGTNSEPVASAALDVVSTTRGFLPPRMTAAQRTAIASPAVGLMVYQTDGTEGLYIFRSTGWALNS